MRILICAAATSFLCSAAAWTVRLEEPTGLYRRTAEVVRVSLDELGGARAGFRVAAAEGREVAHQVAANSLLFPATVAPGQLPVYAITCCDAAQPAFPNEILARRLGTNRVEIGNSRFRVVVDLTVPAIVEAYNLTAAPERVVNLVETTPEDPDALAADIHVSAPRPSLPASNIPGDNTGWTTLGGSGPITGVEFLEQGPLEGRVRLQRAEDAWEFVWTAASPALRWRASKGFRFAAVSAAPFLPFDRFVNGSEYEWPTGPDSEEPPDHDIAPRAWNRLPGGHAVYFSANENYGALGIIDLDPDLEWRDIGSRRFIGAKPDGPAEIAITFPEWQGKNTVLEARRENRILRQPLLVQVTPRSRRPSQRAPAVRKRTGSQTVPLDGDWELSWGEKGARPSSEWRTVRVPGTAHTQWLPEADWYSRRAEWVSEKEWWYRKRFRLEPAILGFPRAVLQFDATDYYAEVFLNGSQIGRHEGYIDPYEYDVTDHLRAGENELLVRVWTPVTYYWRHRPYTIKGSYGAVDQKPDDITPLGITRSVRLVAGPRAHITDVAVDTRLSDNGAASVALDLEAAEAIGHRWVATLSPRNFAGPKQYTAWASVRAGRNKLHIDVPDPQLWWTWDHGKPSLYTLELRLLDARGRIADTRRLAVGIREIEKRGWTFYLNRRRMFIRGTNYYYNLYLSQMNRAAYERDMNLMLGMNINMIRLHCHFSNPEFYDLADERGVLIWQDYLEAWYPHDHEFASHAAALYRNHVRYVRNHACVALWATSDEEDLENYRDITKHLAAIPAALDPQRRPVVRSTGRYGDAHVYYGWYGGSIWQYTKMTESFVSELGATALPNYDSLVRFLPDAWPIQGHEDEWVFHKLQIPEAMRAWGKPDGLTLQQYIPRTQAYVARLFQLALERSRRLKYNPAGGILHFHAIDIWPSVTMAAMDFYRQPTAVYDVVRRSFSAVLASVEYDRETFRTGETVRLPLWLINDRWDALGKVLIDWRIEGAFSAHGTLDAEIGADEVRRAGEVTFQPSAAGPFRLHLIVHRGEEVLAENIVSLNSAGD